MRIVKLSKTEFATLDDVRKFFLYDLRRRKPVGKFCVTSGRIAQDGLERGEHLLFTYNARVVFTALAGGGLVPNHDEQHHRYPSYFVVDLNTLREADEDFHNVERQYNDVTGDHVNLVEAQGWNSLPDSLRTRNVWARLREPTRALADARGSRQTSGGRNTTSRIPNPKSKRPYTVYFFNNCHNLDHVASYSAGAFFDLCTSGRQGNQARNLRPGQVCVVGSWSSGNRVVFKWYSFEYETILRGDDGVLNRVFFGRFLVSEETPKSKAARSARYSALFKVTGDFKQGSVFQKDIPLADRPVGADNAEGVAAKARKGTQGGAGFGDPIENKLVESAAIREVVRAYKEDGWAVHSVERAKCGFDLECRKDRVVKNVEVKGVRAAEPCFIITAGEVDQARKNPNFVLVVVTSALSASRSLMKYAGADFCRRFSLSAIQYRAVLRP